MICRFTRQERNTMTVMTAVLVFVLGCCIGSFCNVCVYRIPRKESIVWGRSHCTACGQTLQNRDLIPLVSWVWLRGRCRGCGAPISPRYPAVELAGGLLFIASWGVFGLSANAVITAAFLSVLLVAALIDFDTMEIPNGAVLAVFVLSAARAVAARGAGLTDQLIGCAAAGLPLLVIALISHGGMGLGDGKLMAAAGCLLGWKEGLLALLLGCVIGAAAALLLVAAGRKSMKSAIPLGPFLAAGCAVAALWGGPLIRTYWGLFLR